MNPQIGALVDELQAATAGFAALAETTDPRDWARRPAEGSWSAAECLAHLNLTSEAYLPGLQDGIQQARRLGRPAPGRYRRDPLGWLLWKTMGPPVRLRVRTAAAFVPTADLAPAELLERFEDLQAELAACLRDADGLPIHRVRVTSPFDARVRYNLFSALSVVPRHQLRHLWQAERAVAAVRGDGDAAGTKPASARPPSSTESTSGGAEMPDEGERSEARDRSEERDRVEKKRGGEASESAEAGDARLEPGQGPRAAQGDALLDGSGTRHGVDERDQRPGDGG